MAKHLSQKEILSRIPDVAELEVILCTYCGPHKMLIAEKKYGTMFDVETVTLEILNRTIEQTILGE